MSARAVPAGRVHRLAPLPWIAAALGLGAVAAESPLLAVGAGTAGLLAYLPWAGLFAVLVASASVQTWTTTVAGLTFRPDELVVVVVVLRAFTLRDRSRLRGTEWILMAFIGAQAVTSLLNAPDVRKSLLDAGLLAFGAAAYLATFAGLSTRDRLLSAARVLLVAAAVSATAGIVALVSHYVWHTQWGVTQLETLGRFPAATGFAYEHDVFGSTSAAGALAFLVLWLQRNPLLSRAWAAAGFWVCAAGLVLSLARGAWIGFAAGIVLAVFVVPRGTGAARGLLSLLLAGAIVIGAVALAGFWFGRPAEVASVGASTATTIGEQAGRVLELRTSTGAARLQEWTTSLREVRGSLLFGLGTNSFGQRHSEQTIRGLVPAFVGNWAVRTLYDSGVVGLALLAAFLASIAWPGPRVRRAVGDLAPVARAFVVAAGALLVAYLATDALLLVWPWILFGITRAARVLSE